MAAMAAASIGPDGKARCVSSQFFWAAADCAPYMRRDSCAPAGTSAATPLTARRATSMRVSPLGSLAFMLPEASSTKAMVRPPVLQLWAAELCAGGAFAREAGGREAWAEAAAGRRAEPK